MAYVKQPAGTIASLMQRRLARELDNWFRQRQKSAHTLSYLLKAPLHCCSSLPAAPSKQQRNQSRTPPSM